MTRVKGNGHGGPRQGTPGIAYSNRSDLNMNRAAAPDTQPPVAGGSPVPAPVGGPPAQESWISPDAVTPLDAPTDRPDEPLTAGLPFGPGPGPAQPTTRSDLLAMKKHVPYLRFLLDKPDTPDSVRAFTNYLISQVDQ